MPHIEGGTLDADTDNNAPVVARPQTYIDAQDALIEALKNDSGLAVAEINKYLPTIEAALGAAASTFPGAAPLVNGLLAIIPKQIP